MQTFLPHTDFEASARALDLKRLGKQRVEVIQIVRALTVPGYAWTNHPAVLMWKGYEEALGRYGVTCCEVWLEAGYGDTCAATIVSDLRTSGVPSLRTQAELAAADLLPPWLGDDTVHASHRSALVRKDPAFYRPLFPDDPDDLDYVWPVRSEAVLEAERRREENVRLRADRALVRAEREATATRRRAEREAAAQRRRRSLAAKRGWVGRRTGGTAPPA